MGILSKHIEKRKLQSDEIENTCNKIVQRIIAISSPERIYLFGSSANDNASELSDFDIAIIFANEKELKDSRKKILQANLFKDIEVDILFYTEQLLIKKSEIGGVSSEIISKGKVIYDKKSKI